MSYDDGVFPFIISTINGDDGVFPIYGEVVAEVEDGIPIDTTPGQGIPLTTQFFTLRGRKARPIIETGDEWDDEPHVEFALWKCRMSDLLQLASGDEIQGVRFKVKALNDMDGNYGGSSQEPYGFIRPMKKP